MKTIIIYHSKTGFTKRYAEWLAQDIGGVCLPYGKRKGADLAAYDAIVFGGRLQAGAVHGAKWFFGQAAKLPGKRLALFFTGAMPPDPQAIERAVAQNVPPQERGRIPAFYLWGGLCYEKMGLADRAMMAAFRRMLAAKKAPGPEEREAAKMVANSYDMAKRENLRELEAYLRGAPTGNG